MRWPQGERKRVYYEIKVMQRPFFLFLSHESIIASLSIINDDLWKVEFVNVLQFRKKERMEFP